MSQFFEAQDHVCRDLTLEFLSTLYVDVIRVPCYQESYISFYLNREFYELHLSAFNTIFGCPPSLDLPYHCVPQEFNPNSFLYKIAGDHRYDSSYSKGMVIRNHGIQVA